ncbi:MAG: cache domain-containing protein [Deltaproteobacteria bacterium]|nr:cache domain-containing protein [Deltaproteobacteria bacterium]
MTIDNIRENYQDQYEVRVKEELRNVTDFIDYRRSQHEIRVERDIRERVQSAYTIASHMYRLYKDEKSEAELRSMVIEVLRPIRWNSGRGYYFTGRIGSGIIDLFADEPSFENMTAARFREITGQDMVADIVSIIRDKGAGIYRYNLVKPKFGGRRFGMITFVKYFKPLDWFIGAGLYNDDLEQILQQDVLVRLQEMQFGKDGEVFGFRFDGTIICNKNKRLIGRSISDLRGDKGTSYGKSFLQSGLSERGEGYVLYAVDQPLTGTSHQKLSFVRAYNDWQWILGASMFMDEMEQVIAAETQTYRKITFQNVFIFVVLFFVAVSFLLFSTHLYSLKIKEGISLFTAFFREAADSNVKISNENLAFKEFETLGRLANKMVDERVKNELLLHRDELRLDTLLRLGMMENHSLQEKYDFVLQRIVKITRSKEGYLALVNDAQTFISIRSSFVSSGLASGKKAGDVGVSRSVVESGSAGEAVLGKSAVIVNSSNEAEDGVAYPYRTFVRRRLDVPIYNDGKIVLVAGVCNNSEEYDNFDIRQMTMLLEGMWLHVLKQCSEEELAKLERQIIAVSEEERSRIGRDLHDDLGSHLTGVELLSKVLQQRLEGEAPEMAEALGPIRNLIRDAIEKTRRLSQGLYPVHVIEYGLKSAVEELVAETENMFSVRCTLTCEGDDLKLGDNTAIHLHYIIREAVFNAARHAEPENVGIFMMFDKFGFSVKIVDDGRGFGEKPDEAGMGFHTMKYRAKAIDAELTIESDAVSGTIVSVSGEVPG